MTVNYIEGDLLTHACHYLVQQCNCQTSTAAGLSKAIFSKWPRANTYSGNNAAKRRPGHIDVIEVTANKHVVSLYGQNYPSKPRGAETAQQRLFWFRSGLQRLAQLLIQKAKLQQTAIASSSSVATATTATTTVTTATTTVTNNRVVVAFPHFIGCGLAGGNWIDYDTEINNFASLVQPYNVVVDVVRLY